MTRIDSRSVNPAAPVLVVEALPDSVVEAMGHDPRSAYAHDYWLPILGPSALAVIRKLIERLEADGERTTVDVAELAASVGLGSSTTVTRNSRIVATLNRLCQFGLAEAHGGPNDVTLYRVRTAWAPITRRQAERLPAHLQARLVAA